MAVFPDTDPYVAPGTRPSDRRRPVPRELGSGTGGGTITTDPPVVSPPAKPASGTDRATADLITQLRFLFPWFDQIGLSPEWFQELAATSSTPEEVVLRLRQEPIYRRRFPGLWREDGSLRMSEAEYLQSEQNKRQLLRQYGFNEADYDTPAKLAGFFEAEVDDNELADRLDTYSRLRDGSQAVRDAFYVYAGLDISVDDLFEATVNKDFEAQLSGAYRERLAAGFDYETFITRATERAGARVAELVSRQDNTLTIQNIPSDPAVSRQILDVLYSTGNTGGQTLSLQELLASYEEAVIGAAAAGAGLGMPTKDRVAQIRAAGIERARATQAYLEFGRRAGSLSAAGQRTGLGAIDRTRFENAAFFGDASATRALETAAAAETAAGVTGGSFRFGENRSGELFQRGLR
jgi:hypothetical protein